mmetsp:Transcript_145719/g.256975  ORF Transcript_145719/g.256975 Transcript_145719/m.256975 type:complete len:91 (-) Transcript_145719:525-797(-)
MLHCLPEPTLDALVASSFSTAFYRDAAWSNFLHGCITPGGACEGEVRKSCIAEQLAAAAASSTGPALGVNAVPTMAAGVQCGFRERSFGN